MKFNFLQFIHTLIHSEIKSGERLPRCWTLYQHVILKKILSFSQGLWKRIEEQLNHPADSTFYSQANKNWFRDSFTIPNLGYLNVLFVCVSRSPVLTHVRLTVIQHGADVLLELEGLVLVSVLPLQLLLAAAGLGLHQRLLQLGLGRHLGLLDLATGHLDVT